MFALVLLQVEDDAVCIQLLQHLDKDALEGCSSNGLGMALHAAAGFGAAHVDVITSGKLPVSFWEQLIAAAKNRSEELMSNDYSGSAKAAVRSLTNTLKRVVDHQLLHDLRMSYKRTA